MTDAQPVSAEQTLRTLRVVFLGIMSGVLLFAGVALLMIMSGGETVPRPGLATARLLVFSWTGLTIVLALAAYRVARSVTEPLSGPDAASLVANGTITLAHVRSRVILTAALTEGATMYGIIVYALTGLLPVLATSIAVAVLGFALAFPRASWFQPFYAPRAGETVIR